MKLFRYTIAIVCLALVPLTGRGQSASRASNSDLVQRIVSDLAIRGDVNELIEDFSTQFSQNPFGLNPSKNAKMVDEFNRAFVTDSLLDDIQQNLQDHLSSEFADSIDTWLNRPYSKKAAAANKEYYTLQGIRERVVGKYELEQNPPPQNRVKLVQTLAKKTSSQKNEIQSQVIIFRSLVSAFSQLSDNQKFSDSQIDAIVSNYRSQVQANLSQEMTKRLLIKYHNLDNNIINQYTTFYDTKAGSWLSKATSSSIHKALKSASDQFLSAVAKPDSSQQ